MRILMSLEIIFVVRYVTVTTLSFVPAYPPILHWRPVRERRSTTASWLVRLVSRPGGKKLYHNLAATTTPWVTIF